MIHLKKSTFKKDAFIKAVKDKFIQTYGFDPETGREIPMKVVTFNVSPFSSHSSIQDKIDEIKRSINDDDFKEIEDLILLGTISTSGEVGLIVANADGSNIRTIKADSSVVVDINS